jgi:hypothetical protein
MKIRPILFSSAMVMAIIEGRKTETRRVIKPQPDDDGLWDHGKYPMSLDDTIPGWYGTVEETGDSRDFTCRYGIEGDILYVRESWNECPTDQLAGDEPRMRKTDGVPSDGWWYVYKAGNDHRSHPDHPEWGQIKWKPSIHMPKEAARIWLKVKKVYPQRLHDIKTSSILREGVQYRVSPDKSDETMCHPVFALGEDNSALHFMPADFMLDKPFAGTPEELEKHLLFAHWAELWCKVNGRQSWDANPWLWVVKFEVLSTTGKPAGL